MMRISFYRQSSWKQIFFFQINILMKKNYLEACGQYDFFNYLTSWMLKVKLNYIKKYSTPATKEFSRTNVPPVKLPKLWTQCKQYAGMAQYCFICLFIFWGCNWTVEVSKLYCWWFVLLSSTLSDCYYVTPSLWNTSCSYLSWVKDLKRKLPGLLRQLFGELCEVHSCTVHCSLCCAAAVQRTFKCRCCCVVSVLPQFTFLFFLRLKSLAAHQCQGQEHHAQGLQEERLQKVHVHCWFVLLDKHTESRLDLPEVPAGLVGRGAAGGSALGGAVTLGPDVTQRIHVFFLLSPELLLCNHFYFSNLELL